MSERYTVPAPSMPGSCVAFALSVALATRDWGVMEVMTPLVSVGMTSSTPDVVFVSNAAFSNRFASAPTLTAAPHVTVYAGGGS